MRPADLRGHVHKGQVSQVANQKSDFAYSNVAGFQYRMHAPFCSYFEREFSTRKPIDCILNA